MTTAPAACYSKAFCYRDYSALSNSPDYSDHSPNSHNQKKRWSSLDDRRGHINDISLTARCHVPRRRPVFMALRTPRWWDWPGLGPFAGKCALTKRPLG